MGHDIVLAELQGISFISGILEGKLMYYYDHKYHKRLKWHFAKEDSILVFLFVLALLSAAIPFWLA